MVIWILIQRRGARVHCDRIGVGLSPTRRCGRADARHRSTRLWYNTREMHANVDNVALLSSKADYTIFSYGGRSIRFAAPYSLRRYLRVKKWHDGYLEVEADYGDGAEEDYIDLRPVLRNLMIDPKKFLKPVRRVEVSYV